MATTLEERIRAAVPKSYGRYLVALERGNISRNLLVELTRKELRIFPEPTASDMFSGWSRLIGDETKFIGPSIVWAAQRPEVQEMFQGEPLARIEYPARDKAA